MKPIIPDDALLAAERLLEDSYRRGYHDATRQAIVRLEMFSAVVLTSVTKQQLVDMAVQYALELQYKEEN